jgi:excinuclease ABC subunit C
MIARPPTSIARLPVGPGVYRFLADGGTTLYIGRATNLRSRVASYWGTLGSRKRLTCMVPAIARIEAVACDSVHEAAWLERNLLEHRKPPWNRAIGGQEVPVAIRLDCRPASPCLTVVHEPRPSDMARHFGPYLGGTKVRLAVAGLNRLLPLAYTSTALNGLGRDMARVLGVDQHDRERLLQALGAVLDRDAAAVAWVRMELQRRREEAARAHAFELAAQLHAELAAIEWVVAEQKAALLEPCDMDVYGWAEDILVSFAIRGGRLCHWDQRRGSETRARPHVSGPDR